MNILIDTHIFLWAISEPNKLSKKYIEELETPANTIYVSSISIVEIIIKNTIGKLDINTDLVEAIKISGFEPLEFTTNDALALGGLPLHHKDPFDRMIISQAINNNYKLMSDDAKFIQYDCKLI